MEVTTQAAVIARERAIRTLHIKKDRRRPRPANTRRANRHPEFRRESVKRLSRRPGKSSAGAAGQDELDAMAVVDAQPMGIFLRGSSAPT